MSNRSAPSDLISLESYAAVTAGLGAGLALTRALVVAGVDPGAWERSSDHWIAEIADSAASDLEVLVAFDAALLAAKRRFEPTVEPIASSVASWAQFRRHFLLAVDPPAFLAERGLSLSLYARMEADWANRTIEDEALGAALRRHMEEPLGECPRLSLVPSRLISEAPSTPPSSPATPDESPLIVEEAEPAAPRAPAQLPSFLARAEPSPPEPPKAPAVVKPPSIVSETQPGTLSPLRAALPFAPAPPNEAPRLAEPSPAAPAPPPTPAAAPGAGLLGSTLNVDVSAFRAALPFLAEAKRDAEQRAGSANPLSLQQYAALCAEVGTFPERAEAVFQRYGLADPKRRAAVDQAWQERLRQNPVEYQAWQRLYQRWCEQLRGGPG